MKLFNLTETTFDNFDQTVRSYLSKTMGSLGLQYTQTNIFGLIFDGIKGIMQNIMFYIEDALNEQNVFTATRKKSIYSLAKISGYEAFYGSSATGTILGKTHISNGLDSKATKIYISDKSQLINKQNNMKYSIILPTDFYTFDITKPLIIHEFKIVQGYFGRNSFTASGKKLESFHVDILELFDKQYIKVLVNGEEWNQVSTLYDMTEDGKEYICNIGYDNTFDITFGNGVYGKKLTAGDNVMIEYLRHNGTLGNILPDEIADFEFVSQGYDSFGNSVNINNYMNIELKTCVSGGTESDSIDFMRNMIGKNSRSLVLASSENFELFFKRFSFIGYVNCWSESNSMSIMVTCLKNIATEINDIEEYLTLDPNRLLLSTNEKTMIQNTLDNSKRSFAGMSLVFQDPIIRKFAIACFVKINDVYNQSYVESEIKNELAKYFMSNITDTQFIAKSKLIELLTTSISYIQSIDINIYSEYAEKAYYDGYYYKYETKYINGSYNYKKVKVIYEPNTTPGLDLFGNIQLDTKLEMPILSSINYYPNKESNNRMSKDERWTMPAVQVYFV